ncbi:dephospho-CoA kinase [Hyunsoonleella pacifica]|uniref:Dephospho-CoA kinase n=1 Tax=Hyunsoonleella pacifica TaxID=1080224 RepID=A0A4Q9FSD6_9FLAO|nr:dephospho-CoA kinase [Hyunsoonleella pacifica]TBN18903.1 dephospho-CoA kinase [Hyunsoonleella pacifica]GGD05727.1 dephospho-CoA kinase [Hyunsoonleella pacifica]
MIIVGLTGGIGSGKTTVAKEFEALGIPVYIADIEAKKLMNRSKVIKRKLIALLGENAYLEGKLNRSYIAGVIFNDKTYLEKMNAIVHPKVARHFEKWVVKQNTSYVIKEVAILFENGGDAQCDYVITVTAPKAIRIQRLLKRDNTSKEKVEAIMKNQWSDSEKIKYSDFVIVNENLEETRLQAYKIHHKILQKIQ